MFIRSIIDYLFYSIVKNCHKLFRDIFGNSRVPRLKNFREIDNSICAYYTYLNYVLI